MCIQDFIGWCNLNQGFLDFVLSVVTIIISVIAIVFSIKFAYLPYYRKIKIMPSAYSTSEKIIMDIIIYNCGNIEIGVEGITVSDNKNLVLGMYNGRNFYIKPGKMKKCRIEIFDEIEYVSENIIDLNNKIVIKVVDMYGKKYTFKNGFPVG